MGTAAGARTSAPAKWRYLLLVAALVAIGGWHSLVVALTSWPIESDILGIQGLMQAMQEHGLRGVTSWEVTSDNWLLSLAPFLMVLYRLAGTSATVILAGGWAVYAATVAAAFVLARCFLPRRGAALLAAAFLFANPMALGSLGSLTYPTSHNSSLPWILLAFATAMRVVSLRRQGRPIWRSLLALVALSTIVTVSDPWAKAALVLPVLFAALFLMATPMRWRRGRDLLHQLTILLIAVRRDPLRRAYLGLVLAALAILWLADKRLIGILYFVPPYKMHLAHPADMVVNAWIVVQALGRLFYLFPFLPVSSWTAGLSFLAVAALSLRAALILGRGFARLRPELRLFVLASALSIAATGAGVAVGQMPQALFVGRYLVNIFLLAPCLFLLAETEGRGRRLILPVVWGGLVMLAGVSDPATGWRLAAPQLGRAALLAPYLEAHDLTYGYGPYHTTPTAAVTWYTDGTVTVRPLIVDPDTGKIVAQHAEASAFWRLAEDAPAGQKRFFLIVGDEGCPSTEICRQGAARQFGPPVETLHYSDAYGALDILVWDHPLLSTVTGRTDGKLRGD